MISNKLNPKSKKMQALDSEYAMLQWKDESRWVRAFKHAETDNYIMQAGYHGLPFDFDLEMTDIAELEDEMRETANLRHWSFGEWN